MDDPILFTMKSSRVFSFLNIKKCLSSVISKLFSRCLSFVILKLFSRKIKSHKRQIEVCLPNCRLLYAVYRENTIANSMIDLNTLPSIFSATHFSWAFETSFVPTHVTRYSIVTVKFFWIGINWDLKQASCYLSFVFHQSASH